MNKVIYYFVFSICLVCADKPAGTDAPTNPEISKDKAQRLSFTVAGEVKEPKAVTLSSNSFPADILKAVKLTEFSSDLWFYVVRIVNVRPTGSSRVIKTSEQIERVHFQAGDTLEDLGIESGDIIIIPSRW